MFFVECKNIPETSSESTLVYSKNQCVIQYIEEGEVNLVEYVIPVLHTDDKESELAFKFDDFIYKCIKKFFVMKIDSKTITFDNEIVYKFSEGDVVEWETRLPKFSCCFKVPKISEFIDEDDSEKLFVEVTNEFLILKTENQFTFRYPLLHCYSEYTNPPLAVNSYFLIRHMKNHEGEFCKLYIEEDFPLCIEFVKEYTERIFVAPLFS